MNVASMVGRILKMEDVEMIFGYPDSPIIDGAAEAGIRPILSRQERVAVHMADAYTRTTSGRKIGVVFTQYGPGIENAFGGIAQAFGDSVPILVLACGYARPVWNFPHHFNSSMTARPITKMSERIESVSMVGPVLERAFTQVRNGRRAPVLLEIPIDLLRGEWSGELDYRATTAYRCGPDPKAVEEVAERLIKAKQPLIYAGQGIHYAEAWQELRELAELLDAPVTTSLQGKSAFPENHPLSLGAGGLRYPDAVDHFIRKSDLIFGIGCSFSPTIFGLDFPKDKTFIHATLDTRHLNGGVRADAALVGDAQLTLAMLNEAIRSLLPRGRSTGVAAEIAAVRKKWLDRWMPKLTSNEKPMDAYRVLWELMQAVDPDNTIVTHDAGSARDEMAPFWVSTQPLSYIGWGKTTQMGTGLGYALGAKAAHPDKLCINYWGDAAVGMTGMDFETAVRARLPILSIVKNNSQMAIQAPMQRVATAKYDDISSVSGNYAELARALGGYGERITEPGEVAAAIRRGIEQTRNGVPAMLEFITHPRISFTVPGREFNFWDSNLQEIMQVH
ncbi:MAG: thiamine pyrophosphate-requiring protein [Steroidobacteraceae bacterium]